MNGESATRWIERASDWANPLLVKETRQALKSRQFVLTFMLILGASWLMSMFGMIAAGDAIEYGAVGGEFFAVYYMVLAVAVLILVPFGVYRSLAGERDHNTFELLSITTLSPRQIVWGKLSSALVQVLIFYSAIAPFIAFASLLQGLDLARAAYMLVVLLLASLMFSMVALMLAAVATQRPAQALLSLIVLGGAIFGFAMVISFGLDSNLSMDDPDFWWGTAVVLLVAASYFVLFHQVTAAQLTFEADNRTTGIRITCAAQFYLLWIVFLLSDFYYTTLRSTSATAADVQFVGLLSAIHWAVVGTVMSTERNELSRRVRRRIPRAWPLRLVMAPLLPGGARGYVYLLCHVVVLWCFAAAALHSRSGYAPDVFFSVFLSQRAVLADPLNECATALRTVTGACFYLVIYAGIGAAMMRWGQRSSGEFSPGHVRVLLLVLFAAFVVLPYLPMVIGVYDRQSYALIDLANPFATIAELDRDGAYGPLILVFLFGAAAVAVLANLRAMTRGVTEVLSSSSPAIGDAGPVARLPADVPPFVKDAFTAAVRHGEEDS